MSGREYSLPRLGLESIHMSTHEILIDKSPIAYVDWREIVRLETELPLSHCLSWLRSQIGYK